MICKNCGTLYNSAECPDCKEAAAPFYRKTLKDGEDTKLLLTIRLNIEERAQLDQIKRDLDINSDGAALKLCCFRGYSVLQSTLGAQNLSWLASKDRLTRGVK
jgi:hypothetical protein